VLGRLQDAEDAFQATFLVLVRKAASIERRELLANWLYGVAYRASLKLKAANAKRRVKERRARMTPGHIRDEHGVWHDLEPLLDQELSRLPDKYRVPILVCDLQGKTRKEAARQLGVPEGTLSTWLARGRVMLAKRLSRHGLMLSGGALAGVLSRNAVSACVPAPVMMSTIKAATLLAAGRAAATGMISAKVAALTEGVVKTMLLTKLKIATVVLLAVAISGAGGLLYRTQAAGQADAPNERSTPAREPRSRAADAPDEGRKGKEDVGAAIADRFRYRIPFETGYTESKEGGRIELREVWGTRPRIEVGGQYLVRGKYVLPPGERGMLYFYETAEGAWGLTKTTNLDLQYTAVDKQEGEFALVHGMAGPGYFHLYLAAAERYSRMFANVYFGTGDNVLRKRP
jgi:RNA polymerase sigma factor (sigma-70 family)